MGYLLLLAAIVFEVTGTTCMKLSEGFTKLLPSVLLFAFYMISFTFFVYALKHIQIGVAYAVWAGVGLVLVAIVGIVYFKEPVSMLKVGSIALIVVGVVGLNMSGIHAE